MAPDDPIKVSRLTLTNQSRRTRRLSVTAYVEWVLGVTRPASAPFVVTELDRGTGAIFARSTWNGDFGSRISFADLGGVQSSWTGDRAEFIGRHGTLARPAALLRGGKLSGRVGAALDPCAALQTSVVIPVGGRVVVTFLLGETPTRDGAATLIRRYRASDFDRMLMGTRDAWDGILGGVQVTTPDPAMDLMLNRWLLYQTVACRIWARAAFYQASGAYGFRDQLQDGMALSAVRPDLVRQQLLLAAGRQFMEGDVQHWWHPPSGRGVRTRISDDLLWLPFVAAQYAATSGDVEVLGEPVPFIEGLLLAAGQAGVLLRAARVRGHGRPCMSTALARSTAVSAWARTDFR